MLKAAVIGAGMMGRNHIRVYFDLDDVELVGVSDVSRENLAKVSKYKVPLYQDYIELIENEKPDLVSLVVPTKFHADIAIDLIERGINVLIEKPISDTIENALKIKEAALKNPSVKVLIGHIERFNPAIVELKKELLKLGKIFHVQVERVGPFPERIRDVGVVIDLAVHDLDIINYILDDKITFVHSQTQKNIHTEHEDLVNALIRTETGIICNLHINWLTPKKSRKLSILGENGMFVVDYLGRSLYFYENGYSSSEKELGVFTIDEGKVIKYKVPFKDLLKDELKHFIDCVLNDKKPLVSISDGIKALELAHKLIK